jgi:hypothetical protein
MVRDKVKQWSGSGRFVEWSGTGSSKDKRELAMVMESSPCPNMVGVKNWMAVGVQRDNNSKQGKMGKQGKISKQDKMGKQGKISKPGKQ